MLRQVREAMHDHGRRVQSNSSASIQDRKIDATTVNALEYQLNCHAVHFARTVGLCAEQAGDKRIKSALVNSNTRPPSCIVCSKTTKSQYKENQFQADLSVELQNPRQALSITC